jgi:GT2 family glycosyltransferase
MKIAICTFAFVLGPQLVAMADSARSDKHEVVFYLSLHSQHPSAVTACETIRLHRPTVFFPYGWNRGLARSLNDAMLRAYADGADVVINCNDDVQWGPGDVDRLAECAMDRRDCAFVSASGWHHGRPERDSMGYCVIAINPIALEAVGCLDENFYPAYYEDCDHLRRARLAGLPEAVCEQTGCQHYGSASILSDPQLNAENDFWFVHNQAYWHRKWGLKLEFETPFNRGDSLRIEPEQRRTPYGPGFDREDLPRIDRQWTQSN